MCRVTRDNLSPLAQNKAIKITCKMLKTSLSLFPKLLFRVKGESKRDWSRGWWGFLAFCCSNSSLGAASMNTVGKRPSYGLSAVKRLLRETIPNSVADLESTQPNRVSNSCYEEVGHAIVSRSNFLRPLHMWSVLKSWNKAGIKPVIIPTPKKILTSERDFTKQRK